ncbi:MAG: hypothetical protein K9M54_04060 [Kiritimatiellales bacterium]|nr:hypothetical protein [Kiritimatiellales bacterium]
MIFLIVGSGDPKLMENESVVFCSDLQPRSAHLLFKPTEIQTVQRANRSQVFTNGIDYTVSADGLISLTPASRIPVLDYYAAAIDATFYRFVDTNGIPFYSPGGTYKHSDYDVVVTYTHASGSLDELEAGNWFSSLTTSIYQLRTRQPLNVTFFGDSITAGAQASAPTVEPFAPAYPTQVVDALKTRFGYDQINYANKAVGGKTSTWGLQEIQQVIDTDPDLVVLAFGMNDASGNTPTATYKQNTEGMIQALRAANPNVGIVLVAEFSPNPEWASAHYDLRAQNRDALYDLYSKYENMAFVDVGAVSRPIAARKKFQDFSGNDLNHPNDFLHKIYADSILNVFGTQAAIPPVLVTNITDQCTYAVQGVPTTSFDGLEYIGVRGALATANAQYGLMKFDLASRRIANATLRLKAYATATPPTWGTNANVNIQIMVMSSNNTVFAEATATYNNQAPGTAWKNSANVDATTLFSARDVGVTSTLSSYLPGANWINATWYDIPLETRTVNALEALRAAGQTNVLLYIQVKNDALDDDGSGVRFYSDDSAYAPELVMEVAPAIPVARDLVAQSTIVMEDFNGATAPVSVLTRMTFESITGGAASYLYPAASGPEGFITYNPLAAAADPAVYPHLRIRMHVDRDSAANTVVQLYPIPIVAGKLISASVPTGTAFQETSFDTSTITNFAGAGCRIDPMNYTNDGTADRFAIDYIMADRGRTIGVEFDRAGDDNGVVSTNVSSVSVSGGVLHGTASNTAPQLRFDQNLTVNADIYKHVEIRMKGFAGDRIDFFWAAAIQPNNITQVEVEPSTLSDGLYHTWLLDFTNVAGWTGTLSHIRLDPVTTPGAVFEVDYIRFLETAQ